MNSITNTRRSPLLEIQDLVSYWEIPNYSVFWETNIQQPNEMDATSFKFFDQQVSGRFDEKKIQRYLRGQKVLDVNSLIYFLKNQYLIPEKYKNKRIYFWGTIYALGEASYVLTIFWHKESEKWCLSYHNLNQDIHCTVPSYS